MECKETTNPMCWCHGGDGIMIISSCLFCFFHTQRDGRLCPEYFTRDLMSSPRHTSFHISVGCFDYRRPFCPEFQRPPRRVASFDWPLLSDQKLSNQSSSCSDVSSDRMPDPSSDKCVNPRTVQQQPFSALVAFKCTEISESPSDEMD